MLSYLLNFSLPSMCDMRNIFITNRYSENFAEGLTVSSSTNQSITGSYVDYARDYYSPNLQNANNFLIQANMQRGETPTYV